MTTTDSSENYVIDRGIWTVNFVVCIAGIAFSAYVTLSLLMYQYIRYRRVKRECKRNIQERRLSMQARVLCILVALFATIFSALKLINLLIERDANNGINSHRNCSLLWQITTATLFLSSFFAYLFLWTRQRVFYIHKALSQLNSKVLYISSYAILVFWIVYCIIATGTVFVVFQYEFWPNIGCLVVPGTGRGLQFLSASFVIVCAFMQFSLLVLFIYPIVKRSSIRISDNSRRSQSESGDSRSAARVMRRIKKAIAIAIVCIVTDIISPILATFLSSRERSSFTSTYVINLCINMISLILCFDNWRHMLFPWIPRKKASPAKTSSTGHTSQSLRSSHNASSI